MAVGSHLKRNFKPVLRHCKRLRQTVQDTVSAAIPIMDNGVLRFQQMHVAPTLVNSCANNARTK